MSIELVSRVLNLELPERPATAPSAHVLKSVLLGLANHAYPDGTDAYPSVSTLMRYTALTRRAVQRALRALVDMRLIAEGDQRIVGIKYRGDRHPTNYNLLIDQWPDPVDGGRSPVDKPSTVSTAGRTSRPRGGSPKRARGVHGDMHGAYRERTNRPIEPSREGGSAGLVVPASSVAALHPPTDPPELDPAVPRCARHAGEQEPPPCHGCRRVRERQERQERSVVVELAQRPALSECLSCASPIKRGSEQPDGLCRGCRSAAQLPPGAPIGAACG